MPGRLLPKLLMENKLPVRARYVEEEDLLALALGGRFAQHSAPLLCQAPHATS